MRPVTEITTSLGRRSLKIQIPATNTADQESPWSTHQWLLPWCAHPVQAVVQMYNAINSWGEAEDDSKDEVNWISVSRLYHRHCWAGAESMPRKE